MNINKYKFLEKLSEGSFGFVYKGLHIRTNEYVAIKSEITESNSNSLKHEAKIYQHLAGIRGIPSLKWFGFDSKHTYLVLPLFTESLKQRKERLNKISFEDTKLIIKSTLYVLKELHTRNMVHCDIKPDNLMIKDNDLRTIYIIDFGFTRRHSPQNKLTRSSIGTPSFMSRRVHEKSEPSYIDDLESLFYVGLFLYYKNLPWMEPHVLIDQMKRYKQTLFFDTRRIPSFFQKFASFLDYPFTNEMLDSWYEKCFRLFQLDQI